MKKFHTIFALLLCLCLTLSLLSGCGDAEPTKNEPTPEPTAAPTPTPTPEPTPEPLDAGKLYREAAERQTGTAALKAEYSITQEITLPDYTEDKAGTVTLREETRRSASYEAPGTEGFRALITEAVTLGDREPTEQRQVYAEGLLYTTLGDGRYTTKCGGGELPGALPLSLLDPALYASAEAEETEDGYTLRFAEASAAESWAVPANAELLEASAEARLLKDGALCAESYELSYRFGGLTVTGRWEAGYERPESLDLSAEIPENTGKYETLDSAQAPLMFERALAQLRDTGAVHAMISADHAIEIAGVRARQTEDISLLEQKSGPVAHESASLGVMSFDTQQYLESGYELDYAKGKLTITSDDGQTASGAQDPAEFRAESYDYLCRFFPEGGMLKDASVKEVGDYWMISFVGNDEYGALLKDAVCEVLFPEQPGILDEMSTAYKTRTVNGFLAVEKVSGLPTALNLRFSGLHTIQDSNWMLTMDLNLDLDLLTEDAHLAIFDRPPEGAEPEQTPTPLLYEVSDGEGHTLYLFGSCSVGDERTACLPQAVYDAFDAADALAVEVDAAQASADMMADEELQALYSEVFFYTDGTPIGGRLDSALYTRALELIKLSGGYNDMADFEKPYVWSSEIGAFYSTQGRGLSAHKDPDTRLLGRARETEKEILTVESTRERLMGIKNYSEALQKLYLAEAVKTSRADYLRADRELYELWCLGDEAALTEALARHDTEQRALLDEREQKSYDELQVKTNLARIAELSEAAEGYLQSGRTVFFCVNVSPLFREGGVLQTLREAGYTVTQIDTNNTII